jgi:sugar (pentulose or hexulose) kinase
MTKTHILVLDLGSSGLRSLLAPVDTPWEIVPGASLPYRAIKAQGGNGLAVRFSPDDLWRRVSRAISEGMSAARLGAADIAAISITSQRQGMAFLDDAGDTLYVGPNTDLRAVFEGATIDDTLAEQVYETAGHLPSLFFTPAKLHWWKLHHPRLRQRIRRVLTLGAWVANRLTGEQADVASLLCEAGLLDVRSRSPASELLGELAIDANLLPPLVREGLPVGGVTREMAGALSLRTGTPVVLAGPDTQTALLGMGATEPGDVGVVAGWSLPVQMVEERPVFDKARRTWVGCHVLASRWIAEANGGDAGGALELVRRLLGVRTDTGGFDALISRSYEDDEGGEMVTAFWGPQALDLSNPGISMGGLLTPEPITYSKLHRAHVARATMENIAYAVRECLERVVEVTGRQPRTVRLSGGMAQSRHLPRMLAGVLGQTVWLHHPRASAVGAAILAAAGPDGASGMAGNAAAQGTAVEPEQHHSSEYGDLYQRWLRLRGRLQELSDEL